jgi:hypothetical protein
MKSASDLVHRFRQLPIVHSRSQRREICRHCKKLLDKDREFGSSRLVSHVFESQRDCPGCDLFAATLATYKDKLTPDSRFVISYYLGFDIVVGPTTAKDSLLSFPIFKLPGKFLSW